MNRKLAITALALLTLSTAACSSSPSGTDDTTPAPAQKELVAKAMAEGAVVLDVRSAEEFAQSRLRYATNAPVEAPQFSNMVKGMDKSLSYVLYCRSGSRSKAAAEIMASLGFQKVFDLGPLENAAAITGMEVVK